MIDFITPTKKMIKINVFLYCHVYYTTADFL